MSGIIFMSVASLCYILMLGLIVITKKWSNTSENKIFWKLLSLSMLSLISEIYITLIPNDINYIPFIISMKIYLVLLILWTSSFLEYVFVITRNNDDSALINYADEYKRIRIVYMIIIAIVICLSLSLPIYFFNENGVKYSYGPSVNVVFILTGISSIIMSFYIIKNFKHLKEKRYVPIIVLVLLYSATAIFQKINPGILLANTTQALITVLMYYTLENPDIRIAKDLAYAKVLVEKNQNKTLKTLNDMSNDLRTSLNKLESFGYKKIDKNNIDKLNEEVKYIQNYSIKLADRINGIIDLAIINNTNELIEEKYETYNMLEDIKHLLSLEKANKKISLITDIKDNISPVLYGDKDKVEHIIIYFFNEIINIIKNGKITLKIDSIEVGRFCRLRFHFLIDNPIIKDHIERSKNSGKLKLVNFGDNVDYKVVKELLTLFKGKIDISENESYITEIILSLDQRIKTEYQILSEKEENKNVKIKYFDLSDKRILIVDDNVVKIRELQALLKPYKIKVSYVVNIEQMRKELSSNITYDLILIDDIIPNFKSDGSDLIKNEDNIVRSIRLNANYKVPTILMVTDNTKHLDEEFIKYGFNSCITKPINKKDINALLIEYFKQN